MHVVSGMMNPMHDPFRRVRIGLIALAIVLVAGTTGYLLLGFDLLDSIYQTVTTVTTVGFTSSRPLGAGSKTFTIVLILIGVGTALYTFSAVLEVLIEGHMRELVRRRKMERDIAQMSGHVIVCGWGRVGREVARFLVSAGRQVVVIDHDLERLAVVPYASVHGDVTDDDTLRQAGIERAATLVAAIDTDADNLYVTVAGRSMRPDLQIIARARNESSEPKLLRAGADRVVNPQQLGGDRMASFVTQPLVVDFVDVVMHDGTLEFRLGGAGGFGRIVAVGQHPPLGAAARPYRGPGAGHPQTRWHLRHQSIARRCNRGGRRPDQRRYGRAARGAYGVCGALLMPCSLLRTRFSLGVGPRVNEESSMEDTEATSQVHRSRRTRRCEHARICSSSSGDSWPSTPRCSRSSGENIAERVVAQPQGGTTHVR